MTSRGFCEHGKIWTTCAICGKEVIAAAATRRTTDSDDLTEYRPKKPTVKPPPEEPAEGAETESEES